MLTDGIPGTRSSLAAGVALLLATLAPNASADGVHDEKSTAHAEALFRDGTQKLDAGEIAAACADLKESLRLDSKLGTLLNLALCHEKQERVATAWAEYTAAAAWAAEAGRPDRRDFAHEHANDLERVMPRVQLDVRAAPSSDVAIDGRILTESEMSLPLFLDPGEHVLIVRGPGERRHLQAFSVLGAGPSARGFALQVVTVSPLGEASQRTAVPESYDTAPRHERDPWTPARRIGLGVAAGGVVAIGVGTYFGVRSLAALGDGVSDRTDARTSEVISMLALGAGAAALGVGTCLWLTPKAGLRGSARLVPSASSHGGGMGIAGTW